MDATTSSTVPVEADHDYDSLISDVCLNGMNDTDQQLETRRKKRRAADYRRKVGRRNQVIEQLENIYRNARRFYWDRFRIRQARVKVLQGDLMKSLPGNYRDFIEGADHILTRDFEKELEWVHIHPKTGKRVPRSHPSLEGLYNKVDGEKSCFCYVVSNVWREQKAEPKYVPDVAYIPIEPEYRTEEDEEAAKLFSHV